MKKSIILLYLLIGCATIEVVLPVQEVVKSQSETLLTIPKTKYKVGQCFYLINRTTGKGDPRDILIIDSITKTKYIYRWWIHWTENWAKDTNDGVGEFSLFERMVKDSKCPK